MEKMRISTIVLTASVAYGAVGNLQVRGVTSTQAILAYTAPDTNACSVEVSESPSYYPLAHDVDPVLFAGSNLDNRPETTASGGEGGGRGVWGGAKGGAEKGPGGKCFSRALQVFTPLFFRVFGGPSHAVGTF